MEHICPRSFLRRGSFAFHTALLSKNPNCKPFLGCHSELEANYDPHVSDLRDLSGETPAAYSSMNVGGGPQPPSSHSRPQLLDRKSTRWLFRHHNHHVQNKKSGLPGSPGAYTLHPSQLNSAYILSIGFLHGEVNQTINNI